MMEVSSVNRNDFDKDLFSNIEIGDDLKRELYNNCKAGKRAGDFRFRYAGLLSALISIAIFGTTGAGAFAYYYNSVQARMEAMPQEEVQEYANDLENDRSVTINGSYSRKLTDDEILRAAELERKYNAEGEFPEENVKRVATLAEWDGKSVCYVEEDNKLYFPDEMSDEDLLSYIDYQTKKDYVMEQEAAADAVDDDVASPYVDVTDVSEDQLVSIGRAAIDKLFGKDAAAGWNTSVETFKPSAVDPSAGSSHDMYFIYWEQEGGSSNSTDYVVCLNMNDLSLRGVAVRGYEHFATLKSYTEKDAKNKGKADAPKVCELIEELYGYSKPDKVKMEVFFDYTDPEDNDYRQIRYKFYYGEKYVDVMWDLSTEKIASAEFFDISEDVEIE